MSHQSKNVTSPLMLNPPLSLLSEDLFDYIVDHVAELPFPNEHLYNLSLTDRVFTEFCQAHLFKVLNLGGTTKGSTISGELEKIKKILDAKPSFANRVRTVSLTISNERNSWLFDHRTWISIVQLLADSLLPPHKLCLSGLTRRFVFQDPVLIVDRLTQTFFSRTLTVLHLTKCEVPLTIFLICPRLREILLVDAQASDWYRLLPNEQCSGRELPMLEFLECRNSDDLVEQMITPPEKFHSGVVLWSKLRVLALFSHTQEGLTCLQPILDAAYNTLEELDFSIPQVPRRLMYKQLSLAGLVKLTDLSSLKVFSVHAVIGYLRKFAVLRDISLVLNTIPTLNKLTNLSFDFTISGDYPFDRCFEEDWDGLCDEIIRVSGGKPLGLNLEISISPRRSKQPLTGQDELYERITERIASLSNHPNICIDFWLPF